MKVSLIAALGKNRVIGKANKMLWHLPADFNHLRRITMGKAIVMGRRTYDSIGGKPLAGRRNIIITRQSELYLLGVEVFQSLTSALQALAAEEEVIIFGGATIYEQAMPRVERMYLTLVDCELEGDTYFPDWSEQEWQEVQREEHIADNRHLYAYSFVTLVRR